jgi:hypothetical protein
MYFSDTESIYRSPKFYELLLLKTSSGSKKSMPFRPKFERVNAPTRQHQKAPIEFEYVYSQKSIIGALHRIQ